MEESVSTVFKVTGMDCSDEVDAIRLALNHPDIKEVDANLMASTVRIVHSPKLKDDYLRKKVESAGVKVAEADVIQPLVATRNLILVATSAFFCRLVFS